MATLQLWLAICKKRPDGGARHWILMLGEEDAANCTWYHSTGGPTQNKSYKVEIQTKRFQSLGVESHHFIGDIAAKDVKKVKASVQKQPAKFCQRWAVDVLGDLEKKGLVAGDTSATWAAAMEVDPYSNDGAPKTQTHQDQADTGPDWVWDAQENRYKYFDTATNQWVWQ